LNIVALRQPSRICVKHFQPVADVVMLEN